ncbi:MAG: hypothetical protein MZV63_21405 [Marinilabiliales bacterium]|nr:hypothetical protein [Marinilabiliales bacterium]
MAPALRCPLRALYRKHWLLTSRSCTRVTHRITPDTSGRISATSPRKYLFSPRT